MTQVKERLAHFAIDAKASLFTVQAFASGMVAVVAHSPKFAVRDFTGNVKFAAGNIEKAALDLSINAGSLEIMDEVRRSERLEIERVMFDDVLETAKFPKIEFRSTAVASTKTSEYTYHVSIGGDLTLHGVTRPMRLESQIVVGEDTLKAQGAFSIFQSDFRLKVVSVAYGTLKLREEIKCTFYIVGRRRD